MRKYLLLSLLLFVFGSAWSQDDSTDAPYLIDKKFPYIKLLLPDSVSYYTRDSLPKKKAVMLMLFNPVCGHCIETTEKIISRIDEFKDVQILMTTSMNFDSMKVFYQKYDLGRFKNITITQDQHFKMISYYRIHQLPTFALYNKDKKFISLHEGELSIDEALEELKK